MIGDSEILSATTFAQDGDKVQIRYKAGTPDEILGSATSVEEAKKSTLAWCDHVRGIVKLRTKEKEAEALAARERRKTGDGASSPQGQSLEQAGAVSNPGTVTDAKGAVLAHYDSLQAEIDALGELIKAQTETRNRLRKERDDLEPVIRIWRGMEDNEEKS